MSEETAKAAGGKIYTSGSYRLRIHEPNSDIDAICVAPQVRRGVRRGGGKGGYRIRACVDTTTAGR